MKTEPEHSAIGPSALHRLLACPASHKLSIGAERKSSAYAAQGSVAHQIPERTLGETPFEDAPALGDVLDYDGHEITVDQDMIDGAAQMIAFCEPLKAQADQYWVEQRVDMGKLWEPEKPPEPLYGTVDFGAYIKKIDTLYIVDFKYGRMDVSPHDNPQAFAYGLGACYELGHFPANIVLVIIQPRGQTGNPVKIAQMTGLDLMIWADDILKPGVDRLVDPAAPFATGNHCTFCAVKIKCPALHELAKKTSRTEFSKLPPDPMSFDGAELANILDNIDVIQKWFEAVRAEASGRIEKAKSVPGWKLVPKRAIRKWADQKLVEQQLDNVSTVWDRKLKSPTQVEKVDPEVYQSLVDGEHISRASSGTTLAPDHDTRTAVKGKSAKEEFGKIEQ
jgi:hypothetical protein